jgi:hypothetical protein
MEPWWFVRWVVVSDVVRNSVRDCEADELGVAWLSVEVVNALRWGERAGGSARGGSEVPKVEVEVDIRWMYMLLDLAAAWAGILGPEMHLSAHAWADACAFGWALHASRISMTDTVAVNRLQTTTKYMTKYERARVLGTRALQIRCGVHPACLSSSLPWSSLCGRLPVSN